MPTSRKTRAKPLLVGEANPYGGDPYYALYPAPEGCSGHRLCRLILGMYRKDYLRVFDRTNLCPHRWDMREAYRRAAELRTYRGPLILLGSKVARAFEFNPFDPFTISGTILILPHPSGRCRTWSEVGAFKTAQDLVARLCPHLADLLGRKAEANSYEEDQE